MLDREEWAQAFELWLESKLSAHTRLAYRKAWQMLLLFSGKMPWELEQDDLLKWVQAMQRRGYRNSSIRLRLSAIRSFYRGMQGLGVRNPAEDIQVRDGGVGRILSQQEVDALLGAIPKNTLNGKRDYALFLCFLTTTGTSGGIRRLTHRQVVSHAQRTWLVWQAPGRNWREPCCPRLQEALEIYLSEPGMADRDPQALLFTAWPGGRSTEVPLSMSTVSKLLRKYARRGGLSSALTIRILRKTALEEKRNAIYR
jgi:site-specific recombinase XerD